MMCKVLRKHPSVTCGDSSPKGEPIIHKEEPNHRTYKKIERNCVMESEKPPVFTGYNSGLKDRVKLSIVLDTLTARILKLSSDSQSRIEPAPLYSRRKPADC